MSISLSGQLFTGAFWIWKKRQTPFPQNDHIVAVKTVALPVVDQAMLRIAVDTRYRLYINGQWVNDGPARSWPDHYCFDVIEVTDYLQAGENEIRVLATYYGVGTFQQVPQEPGILAMLEGIGASGEAFRVVTDASWQVAEATGWASSVPRTAAQLGFFETYDAREDTPLTLEPAAVRYSAEAGPWQGLQPREVPLLTRIATAPRQLIAATVANRDWQGWSFPTARLLYPEGVTANNRNCMASGLTTLLVCETYATIQIEAPDQFVSVDGLRSESGTFTLDAGEHLLLAVGSNPFSAGSQDTRIRMAGEGYTLVNPVEKTSSDAWCFIPFDSARSCMSDLDYAFLSKDEHRAIQHRTEKAVHECTLNVTDRDTLLALYGDRVRTLGPDEVMDGAGWQFQHREPVADGAGLVQQIEAALLDTDDATVIQPSPEGDVELVYDLGMQNMGYYGFQIKAEAGLVVDCFGVEYISPEGVIQHTGDHWNGLRYVCRKGDNFFVSLHRRSQRYLFLTLRNQTQPVELCKVRLIESTYPVPEGTSFSCSDPTLNQIHALARRTLKLCMEDTYTDCPLYEQTHWVGDMRHEALFGYTAFGAYDLARHCLRLAGQSVERFPVVLSQAPTTNETILPAWSFLWQIAVWEYYSHTGDKALLEEVWPWMVKNMDGAAEFQDGRGLFSGPFHHMFRWGNIDDGHDTVIHDSMFLAGALQAAIHCAEVLDQADAAATWTQWRTRLCAAINALWDDALGGYPDSMHEDGTVSAHTSMQTSFLSVLFDVTDEALLPQAARNCIDPPEWMAAIGSPFTMMLLWEALERLGHHDRILDDIIRSYQPMLAAGATTAWEHFPGTGGDPLFPTRSHCHGWSAAPLYFLPRIILGIRPDGIGGSQFVISPRPGTLDHAQGKVFTPHGAVEIAWMREGDELTISAQGPASVGLRFERNDALAGITITYNGEAMA